jgi:hypothetical protein
MPGTRVALLVIAVGDEPGGRIGSPPRNPGAAVPPNKMTGTGGENVGVLQTPMVVPSLVAR